MQMIEAGSRVQVIDAEGLEAYGIKDGMLGMCNSHIVLPNEGDFIYFMPDGEMTTFVIDTARVVVIEDDK